MFGIESGQGESVLLCMIVLFYFAIGFVSHIKILGYTTFLDLTLPCTCTGLSRATGEWWRQGTTPSVRGESENFARF